MRPKTNVTQIKIALDTVSQQILGPNPYRKAIILMARVNEGGTITLSTDGLPKVGEGPINLAEDVGFSPTYPYQMTDDVFGDAIGQPWFLISTYSGKDYYLLEVSYVPGQIEPAW